MPTTATDLERLMLNLINAERTQRGLPELRLEQHLNQSADAHSNWMLTTDTFSHTGEDGSSATDRIIDAGYDLSGSWGTRENLALTPLDGDGSYEDEVRQSHQNLMDSPSHRENILDPDVTEIGIGIGAGEYAGSRYLAVTQNFGYTDGDILLDPASDGALTVIGTGADERLYGGPGDDTIDGNAGHDTIASGGGDDVVRGGYGRDSVTMGNGDDIFIDNDQRGRLGFDTIDGGRGDDEIRGGGGNDDISGEIGFDTLEGGAGNDTIKGSFGDDEIDGGSGHDVIFAGANDDTVEGGFGRDRVYMNAGTDVYIDSGQGGYDGQDNVRGGTGYDEIRGGGGDDQFRGGGGDDTISGGSGDDLVVGHQGYDVLRGDSGNDTLYGNFGQDVFIFTEGDDVDRIADYATGWDELRLDADLFDGVDVETYLERNATVADGTMTIDFGDGDTLILDGATDVSALAEDVTLI